MLFGKQNIQQDGGLLVIVIYIGKEIVQVSKRRTPENYLQNGQLFADMAYIDELLEQMLKHQNFLLNTPVKKGKKQKHDPYLFDKLWSTAVSRVRQPIESLFNWINEKTGIQIASKVRSFKGLMVHVFGRLAAAMFIMAFNS